MTVSELKQRAGRGVMFYPAFVKICGGVAAALMVSQLLYWSDKRKRNQDGWVYKTLSEWEAETGLTRKEQETARRYLRQTPFWEETYMGLHNRLHYRLDLDALGKALASGTGPTKRSRLSDAPSPSSTADNPSPATFVPEQGADGWAPNGRASDLVTVSPPPDAAKALCHSAATLEPSRTAPATLIEGVGVPAVETGAPIPTLPGDSPASAPDHPLIGIPVDPDGASGTMPARESLRQIVIDHVEVAVSQGKISPEAAARYRRELRGPVTEEYCRNLVDQIRGRRLQC